jgi:hypothetical protein
MRRNGMNQGGRACPLLFVCFLNPEDEEEVK